MVFTRVVKGLRKLGMRDMGSRSQGSFGSLIILMLIICLSHGFQSLLAELRLFMVLMLDVGIRLMQIVGLYMQLLVLCSNKAVVFVHGVTCPHGPVTSVTPDVRTSPHNDALLLAEHIRVPDQVRLVLGYLLVRIIDLNTRRMVILSLLHLD